jgi:O-antigen/teichoic acid export membrane protein
MNLEDLMEVWRSQDAAPLHGVNETLLRLALRQDEAKLQARRRREKWFIYTSMAMLVGLMALFLAIMIQPNDDNVLSGWDYTVAVVGLASALIVSRMTYVGYRAQARREQGFGESLRDQLNRQIAMMDPFLTFSWGDRKNVAIVMLGFGCSAALAFVAARINDKPYDEAWAMVRGAILYSVIAFVVVGWLLRRLVRRDLRPRKRRLEALLKELDG